MWPHHPLISQILNEFESSQTGFLQGVVPLNGEFLRWPRNHDENMLQAKWLPRKCLSRSRALTGARRAIRAARSHPKWNIYESAGSSIAKVLQLRIITWPFHSAVPASVVVCAIAIVLAIFLEGLASEVDGIGREVRISSGVINPKCSAMKIEINVRRD